MPPSKLFADVRTSLALRAAQGRRTCAHSDRDHWRSYCSVCWPRWAETGATWAEQTAGVAPHAAWTALAWVLSIIASLGIITGALFLMPAVTALVGSFFVDEVGEAVEREHYPLEPAGRALPFLPALVEGTQNRRAGAPGLSVRFAIRAASPGSSFVILFLANAYLARSGIF